MEFKTSPDRYDGNRAIAWLVAANVRTAGDHRCIQLPFADDDEFEICFAGDIVEVDEPALESAKSLMRDIGNLDNQVQEACAAECRKSGLHPRNFQGELAYITMSRGSALLHYFGTQVNTEWDEIVTLKQGKWTYSPTSAQ